MASADRALIALLAIAALLAWPVAAALADGSAGQVTITGPAGTTMMSLTDDARVDVAGKSGTVEVVVSAGRVRVTDSSCPDLLCVKTGAISAAGSVVACVPNGVIVRIGGGGDDGLDARIR